MAQSWPGWPCGGFRPGAVLETGGTDNVGAPTGETGCGAVLGFEFNGAPTAIAQSWPGWPCGGFIPGAVVVGAGAAGGTSPISIVACGLSAFRSVISVLTAGSGLAIFSAVAVSPVAVFLSSVQPKKQNKEADNKRVVLIFMR